jgi:lipoprotein-anchoring transpeptidase ErfK/SrfK
VAVLVAGWYAGQVWVLDHSDRATVTASVAGVGQPLMPDEPIQVSASGTGVQLLDAQLFRADLGGGSNDTAEQPVATVLQPADAIGTWAIRAANGVALLQPDGAYRLVVHVAELRPSFPSPRTEQVEQQYRFATVESPHPDVPARPIEPRWAEPISFTWSEPMNTFVATVAPAAPLKTWIDRDDPRKTWVQVGDPDGGGLADGQEYQVNVSEAQGTDGISLQHPFSFGVNVPPRPLIVDPPTDPVILRDGDTFSLKTSIPVSTARARLSDDAPAEVSVGADSITVDMPDYQQGAEFDLDVLAATSSRGAPLVAPVTVHFVTPDALDPPTVTPDDGGRAIQPSAHPKITFDQPLANPDDALTTFEIEPPVDGQWQWSTPTTAEFVPSVRLPILSDVTVTVHGGPDGARTEDGGFLDGDTTSTFHTTDVKRIDVSLSHQTMTLYENGRAIRTIAVATGVAAAPTPTGTFAVQYKAQQMRFRGVNPDGSHYDIPDVHWVMPFWGDYTIHGAYWRPQFGVPGSDGCVSMSDADAKSVYIWADVGTPVTIHS